MFDYVDRRVKYKFKGKPVDIIKSHCTESYWNNNSETNGFSESKCLDVHNRYILSIYLFIIFKKVCAIS